MFRKSARRSKDFRNIFCNEDGLLDYDLGDICNALFLGKKSLEDFGVNSWGELKEKLSDEVLDNGREIIVDGISYRYSTMKKSQGEKILSEEELDKELAEIEELDAQGNSQEVLRKCKEYFGLVDGIHSVSKGEECLRAPEINKQRDNKIINSIARQQGFDRNDPDKSSNIFCEAVEDDFYTAAEMSANPPFETPEYLQNLEEKIQTEEDLCETIKSKGGEVSEKAGSYRIRSRIVPKYSEIKDSFRGTSLFGGIRNICRKVKDNLEKRSEIEELISVGKKSGMDIYMAHPVFKALPAFLMTGAMVGASAVSIASEKKIEINKISSGDNYEVQNLNVETRANSGNGACIELSQDYVAWKTQNNYVLSNGGGDYEIRVSETYSDKSSVVSECSAEEGVEIEFDLWGDKIVYTEGKNFIYYNCSTAKSEILKLPDEDHKFRDLWLVENDLLCVGYNKTLQTNEILHYDFETKNTKPLYRDPTIDFLRFSGKYFSYVDQDNILRIFKLTGNKIERIGGMKLDVLPKDFNLIHLSNNYAIYPSDDKLFSFALLSGLEKEICDQREVYDSYNNYLVLGAENEERTGKLSVLDLTSDKEYVENEYVKGTLVRDASIFGEEIAYNAESDNTVHIASISDFSPSSTSQQPSTSSQPSEGYSPEQLTFVQITDTHITPNNKAYTSQKFSQLIALGIDGVLLTGDVVNTRKQENFQAFKDITYQDDQGNFYLDSAKKIPIIMVPGNHDDYNFVGQDTQIATAYGMQTFYSSPIPYTGDDFESWSKNIQQTDLSGLDCVKTLMDGKVLIVGINSGMDYFYSISGIANDLKYAPQSNGISNKQCDALEDILEANKDVPTKVVIMHHTTNFKTENGEIWAGPIQNRERFNSILEKYDCAVLAGHIHEDAHEEPLKVKITLYVETPDFVDLLAYRFINFTRSTSMGHISTIKSLESRMKIECNCPVIASAEVDGNIIDQSNSILGSNYQVMEFRENDYATDISFPYRGSEHIKVKYVAIADGEMHSEIATNNYYILGDQSGKKLELLIPVEKKQTLLYDSQEKTVKIDINGDGKYDRTIDVQDGTLTESELEEAISDWKEENKEHSGIGEFLNDYGEEILIGGFGVATVVIWGGMRYLRYRRDELKQKGVNCKPNSNFMPLAVRGQSALALRLPNGSRYYLGHHTPERGYK